MTARWVVEQVAPERDLAITWEPISLLLKNDPEPGAKSFAPYAHTHSLLRVMESVRTAEGNDGVFRAYWEFGTRTHHDGVREELDVSDALRSAGVDPIHATAYGDDAWDREIRRRMDVGLQLAGDDIGTPIIAFENVDGERVGIFGPVITRVPAPDQSLQLWDGMVAVTTVPGFWELKRTRTERPDFGDRPSGRG